MSSTGTGSSTNPWRHLASRDEVADALLDLYRDRGSAHYDEAVTQTEHALQAGALAMANQASDPLIVAALFHDIGHLLIDPDDARWRDQDLRHEETGARFLARWFDDDVILPIRLHVPAKRALCSLEPAYARGLSPASVRSLEVQGGPFVEEEMEQFLGQLHAEAALRLRRWDDAAKDPGAPTPTLGVFRSLVVDVMRRP
jgi:phosphonate degradation associated HDIG domain protein